MPPARSASKAPKGSSAPKGPVGPISAEMIRPPFQFDRSNPRWRRLLHEVPESILFQLFEETRGVSYGEFRRHPHLRELSELAGVPPRYLYDALRSAGVPHQYELLDESAVEVGVISNTTGRGIDLAKLSSGEKQIISLFSKLYLEKRESLALLFDGPELSLSIEWQRMLLPDIMASGNCDFLLATIHSPFIFENEFDCHARDLREFTSRLI